LAWIEFMRYLSLILCFFMICNLAPAATKLLITVVEGEGAINNIRQRTARDPIVQIEDENRKPVAGAVVVFMLPEQGASGTFAGGIKTVTLLSDEQGRASARGLQPNNVSGKMEIRVTASYQGQSATAVIAQTNALAGVAAGAAGAAATGISAKVLAIVAIASAAVAGGVVAATRNGGSPSAPGLATTIAPGAGTVGPPR
jgi:hypothetical protein